MKQCLIVDDDSAVRSIARAILESLNFAVTEAEDATAALDACRLKMPDAIFLDGTLPAKSGLKFMRQVRSEPLGTKPVIVCCMVENDLRQIAESIAAGANEYLLKPYDTASVREKFSGAGLI